MISLARFVGARAVATLSLAAAGALLLACQTHTLEKRNVAVVDEEATPLEVNLFGENADSEFQPIALSALRSKIRRGTVIGSYTYVPLTCDPRGGDLTWATGVMELADASSVDMFADVMAAEGVPVVGSPTDIFGVAKGTFGRATYLVGGLLEEVKINPCLKTGLLGNWDTNGAGTVTIEWMVLDRANEEVIYRKKLDGYAEIKSATKDGALVILEAAVADSMAELARDRDFRDAIRVDPIQIAREEAQALEQGLRSAPLRIDLPPPRTAPPSGGVPALVDGTVRIDLPGAGHGSGFLISPTLILTNHHVVTDEELVTVVLSSGREVTAEVLRSHEQRDIALLQIAPVAFTPLRLRRSMAQVGEEIYVIGSPLDQRRQGTVTRGIISNVEISGIGMEDLVYDATTFPGNSGGAVVDLNGNVVAVHYRGGGGGGGDKVQLNGGVPIMDGLKRLGVEVAYDADIVW